MTHRTSLQERFWSKVDKTDTCWLWTGRRNYQGYGSLAVARRPRPAHRIAYELTVGPVASDLVMDHLCRNPPCVNPAHLEPVTKAENARRSPLVETLRHPTHCKLGHPFDEKNTEVYRYNRVRRCRTCRNRRERMYRSRQRLWHVLPARCDCVMDPALD